MNDIVFELPFSQNDIDVQNYTVSLLSACLQSGIINAEEAEKINRDITEAFTETCEQFTKRESSSIGRKRAELIYSSVLYWSDIYLLNLGSANRSIQILKTCPMSDILKHGCDLILKIHKDNARLYEKLCISKIDIDCYEYNYVINKSFKQYKDNYSARFDARNCCASIDYPLLNCPAYNMTSQGVMFINEYYTKLILENEFCRLFDDAQLKKLMIQYGKIYGSGYNDLLFNIAEIAANNYLAGILIGKEKTGLGLDIGDIKEIRSICDKISESTVREMITDKYKKYKEIIDNDPVWMYIAGYIPEFTAQICRCAQSEKSLENFLICVDM